MKSISAYLEDDVLQPLNSRINVYANSVRMEFSAPGTNTGFHSHIIASCSNVNTSNHSNVNDNTNITSDTHVRNRRNTITTDFVDVQALRTVTNSCQRDIEVVSFAYVSSVGGAARANGISTCMLRIFSMLALTQCCCSNTEFGE